MPRNPPKTLMDHIRIRVRKMQSCFVMVQANARRNGPHAIALINSGAAEGEAEALALEKDLMQVFELTKPAPRTKYRPKGSKQVTP